jgi:hypothetical protein
MNPNTSSSLDHQLPNDTPYSQLQSEFVGEVRSALSTLTGEIALRNKTIQENDGYIYGDLLDKMLDIPVGHDKTSVNWLRRTVEVHRTQFMGRGFNLTSTYNTENIDVDDPQEQKRLVIENEKRKEDAQKRRELIDAIMRDNGGDNLFARLAENASAIGTSVVKTWYDEDKGKFIIQMVETVEHCYAIWSKDDFRQYDLFAYVYQVSKQTAQRMYGVGEDVATSPLGMPLAVLSSANITQYISTQPMVTIMEIAGKAEGWKSRNGIISRCPLGEETELNAIIVGNQVFQLIDDEKKLPRYYILPNKLVRRRPWGQPDVTKAAINLNLTYIETLSDWRTLASKVNFPKFKYFGFGPGAQIPKPKSRTVEALPLVEGQDVQPLNMPSTSGLGEQDFQHQLAEIQNQYVREVGISKVLFDDPDLPMNSHAAMVTAMKSIGDITETKRQLWAPIIVQMFQDALDTLAKHDSTIADITDKSENWYLRVSWPSVLNKDDPTYQTMLLNRFNANTMSLQSFLEAQGESSEEVDRIREEMQDKLTAAIHGHEISLLAQQIILPPPTQMPPKVNVNLRGDLTPNQEADIAQSHGIVRPGDPNTPFPNTIGPQGNEGLNATDRSMNVASGTISNVKPGATAVQKDAQGNTVQPLIPSPPQANSEQTPTPGGQQPEMIAPGGAPNSQPMSQPGSGAPATTSQGKLNQQKQRKGK